MLILKMLAILKEKKEIVAVRDRLYNENAKLADTQS
jgi:hypothetical protein